MYVPNRLDTCWGYFFCKIIFYEDKKAPTVVNLLGCGKSGVYIKVGGCL